MSKVSLASLLLSFFLVGCSSFDNGRTYLSEMETDDSSFFRPREDFPVVSGDTGRDWYSESERKKRTPASESELIEDRFNYSLKSELKQLESVQSDEEIDLYNQHKHKLSGLSEKIYFLKLSDYEKREYLSTRGLIVLPQNKRITDHNIYSNSRQEVVIGMTKDNVLDSIGKPLRVEIAGNPRNQNERWMYKTNGALKYIYFESGHVQGWE